MDIFLGIPQEIWKGIFTVAKVLIPGLILAVYAIYYQQRKKREIQMEGAIAKVRIQSYERLVSSFSKIIITDDPSLEDEDKINGIKQYVQYPDLNFNVPSCTKTESNFDNFYNKITNLLQNEQIYLDVNTKEELEKSVALFTHCKMSLDAFCDTERAMPEGQSEAEIQKKIDFAYLMTAVMMKSQYNRTFLSLEDTIDNQLRHLRLGYKHYYIKKVSSKVSEKILRFLDKRLTNKKVQSVIWSLMGKDYKAMSSILIQLVEVYCYIHVMDKYTPGEYFRMDEKTRMSLDSKFFAKLFLNIHY